MKFFRHKLRQNSGVFSLVSHPLVLINLPHYFAYALINCMSFWLSPNADIFNDLMSCHFLQFFCFVYINLYHYCTVLNLKKAWVWLCKINKVVFDQYYTVYCTLSTCYFAQFTLHESIDFGDLTSKKVEGAAGGGIQIGLSMALFPFRTIRMSKQNCYCPTHDL